MHLRKLSALMLLLALAPWMAGCASEEEFSEFEATPEVIEDDHDHHEHGPHDGHLIDLGEHAYMAEVVYDATNHALGVYILDHDEMKAFPIDQQEIKAHLHFGDEEQEFTLAAKPQEGEAEGKSSYFELAGNEEIKEHVTDVEDLEGEIIATIEGETYEGMLSHDHDDHDHGHDH
ncbi:MAG: hypothetical protein CMJ46_10090 [Planctomyces sp.]|nr:hypothetical protein [Planctomyces sp.]